MSCEFVFLAVGNADSIIISPGKEPSVVVDVPKPRAVTDWLRGKGKLDIACIYITHGHRDHFTPLVRFTNFLEQWFGIGGKVSNLFIPQDILASACNRLEALKTSDPVKYNELHRALERIDGWRISEVHFHNPLRSETPSYSHGELSVRVLHPEYFHSVRHTARAKGKLNERSLLLRVCYGKFAAVLLADLEGEGLSECLKVCKDHELKAHLVKIPHHGAWPSNGADLETLLRKISAELAVLSVGSKNPHGHVVPELFQLLLTLKSEKTLRQFICTEATRTCVHSASERKKMSTSGLAYRLECAGDVTVTADVSGSWTVGTATNHVAQLSSIKYAVCEGHGELS